MVINILWLFVGVFVGVSVFAGIFFLLYGLLHVGLCLRKGRGTIDQSNVWNRLMGVTYTAMHPEVFGGIEFWKNDLCENIKLVKKAVEDIESCGSQQVDGDAEPLSSEEWLEVIAGAGNDITGFSVRSPNIKMGTDEYDDLVDCSFLFKTIPDDLIK